MAGSSEIFVFKDALIILGTAAVVAPVVHRLKVSPVLGFFAVGAALGPHGLGRLADYSRAIDWLTVTGEKQIAFIADLGIVFLLFFIGLELSMRRLLTMRRLVFGLGGLQGLLTTVVISFGALWYGQPPAAALIIGACLALSSTALVMEVLSGQRRMMSTAGRTSFAILLAQDLAVVPLLFLIGVLGSPAADTTSVAQGVIIALVEAGIAVAVIAVVGRLVLKPLFKLAAGTDNPDKVMATMKAKPWDDPVFGKSYIRADGRNMHDMYLFEVKKPSESKGPWDYYNLIATIPAEEAFRPLDQGNCPMVAKKN